MPKFFNFILIFPVLFFSFFKSNSQDLIVTQQQDSLNCYITRVKSDYIHFLLKNTDGEVINSLMPRDLVTYYEVSFFDENELSEEIIKLEKAHTGVFLAIDYSYSNRLGKVDSNIPNDLAKQLKNGSALSIQFTYFFSNTGGLGFLYSNHSSNATFSNALLGSGTDKVNIKFIAPTYFFQNTSELNKLVFTSAVSIGYLGFEEVFTSTSTTLNLKGSNIGVGYMAYLGAQLNDIIRLSAKAGIIVGTLNSVEINGQTVPLQDSAKENLSTFSIGASLGFLLK